jgi:hypothetical protein
MGTEKTKKTKHETKAEVDRNCAGALSSAVCGMANLQSPN